jgi:hypothetical protein
MRSSPGGDDAPQSGVARCKTTSPGLPSPNEAKKWPPRREFSNEGNPWVNRQHMQYGSTFGHHVRASRQWIQDAALLLEQVEPIKKSLFVMRRRPNGTLSTPAAARTGTPQQT